MSADQLSINHNALLTAAQKVERIGYDGDAYRFVEGLVLSVLADGFRKLEPPPPLTGPSSTPAGRRRARELFAQVRREREEGR